MRLQRKDRGGNEMRFEKISSKNDPVITYSNKSGTIRISKRPSSLWIAKRISIFNILGETVGEFETLEDAIKAV